MKKYIIPIVLMISISCDQGTTEFIEDLNNAPLINLGNGSETPVVSDSIKVNLDFKSDPDFYLIKLSVTDENNNLDRIQYTQLEGIGVLLQEGDTIRKNTVNVNSDDELEFEYYPQNFGNHTFLLTAIDEFEMSSSARIELVAFENLPPVAVFDVSRIGQLSGYHYKIDASESFDRDEKYGGSVVEYEYTVLDRKFSLLADEMEFIFPGEGTYRIIVRVRDNNDDLSDKNELIIEIR